ncbi:phenylalanine--tRNA ligase subunit beta, partial [Candidatus Nomurabacteria bacterium]|nr:phenylalanine--tRNA ligase subunit beta [Candidatus Nomurabacteria bacterium]
ETPACRRYSARVVRNIKIGPSPDWMVKHLESIGQRSINNVVDATNIVMYDIGQPTHAFDARKITNYELRITSAKEGEELPVVGRDGIVAKLKESDVVIRSGDKTLALGGVKGGLDSGITEDTTDIVIEVANFDPTAVRKTARRLNLLSDSAKRFENDLSPTLCDKAMFELSALLTELFPEAIFEDIVNIYPIVQEKRKLSFSVSDIKNKLGLEIPQSEIEKILMNYEFLYTKQGDIYMIEVPDLRLDLENSIDMVEEIGRVYGYDKVVPVLPKLDFVPQENATYIQIKLVRDILVRTGHREVMTYSFTNTGDVEVLASASDKKFLRTNLTDGIKKSYEMNKLNLPVLGGNEVKIFEIGTVFKNGSEKIHVVYANKKEVKEMTLEEFLASRESDFSGPRVGSPDHEKSDSRFASDEANSYFKMWSIYPFIARDIAVWVPDSVTSESLKEIYREFGTELLQGEPVLFDSFTKEGRTSYAFRLIFQSYDCTLTDEEISVIMANITDKLSSLEYTVR